MKLVISLDVEEEGLFSGRYPRESGVTNVAELRRLEFIPREFGLPLTLLVSYRVARDPAACQVLARWRDLYRAEIGVHLHPWSTPPFADLPVAGAGAGRAVAPGRCCGLNSPTWCRPCTIPWGSRRRLSAWAASISAPGCWACCRSSGSRSTAASCRSP